MKEFKARQVQRSIQRFRDYARDLIGADMNTFNDRINIFLDFCKQDIVFCEIHNQLLAVSEARAEDWYAERVAKMSSSAGSASLDFPTNIDQRVSLQYKLLLAIHSGTVNFNSLLIEFFAVGSNSISLYISAFCDAVVAPLCRELDYKLQEIEDELPSDMGSMVSGSVLQVISNTGTFIQQTAVGNANVQTANQTVVQGELAELFARLRDEIMTNVTESISQSEALEVIAAAENEVTKESPGKAVVGALLKALPKLGNIAAIVSAILAAL